MTPAPRAKQAEAPLAPEDDEAHVREAFRLAKLDEGRALTPEELERLGETGEWPEWCDECDSVVNAETIC